MDDTRFFKKKIICLCLCGCFLGFGCATVNVPNVGQQGFSVADDERRMHKRAEEMCEILDDSGHIYPNTKLENYLNELANRLLSKEVKDDQMMVKVKVLRDPSFNAFAFPNGRLYIHTGLLAAMDNEAQLAALLSHEMTHAVNRHALKQFRSLTNKSALFATMQIPVAVFGGDLASIIAQLSIVSSVYGYSRELETEADREGFQMMVNAGYDPREAPKLFEHLRDFIDDEDLKQPFFFSTHPRVVERVNIFNGLLKQKEHAQATKIEAAVYRGIIRPLVVDNVSFCLQTGVFKTASKLLDKYVGEYPDDASGYFYRGELYRQRQDHDKRKKERDKTPDYPMALESYERAIGLDSGFAQAYREKGKVLQKLGRNDEAKIVLQKYLEINPDAKDREYVEQFLLSH